MLTRHMADNHYSLANIGKCFQMHFYAESLTNWNWRLLFQICTFHNTLVKWYGIGISNSILRSVRKCLQWFNEQISGGSINQHYTDGICITLLLMAAVSVHCRIHWPHYRIYCASKTFPAGRFFLLQLQRALMSKIIFYST